MNILMQLSPIFIILVAALAVLMAILWTFKRPMYKYLSYIKLQIFAGVYLVCTAYTAFLEYTTEHPDFNVTRGCSVILLGFYLVILLVFFVVTSAIKIRNSIPDGE